MPPFPWAVTLDRTPTHKPHTLLLIRAMVESSLGYLDKP